MKKMVMVFAVAAAVLGMPLFAENKVGKVTGIQINDKTATVSIAEGLINPFAEDFFVKSGDLSVTVPVDVAVEVYFPKPPKAPEGKKVEKPSDKAEEKRPSKEPPALSVRDLKVDQLVQIVYADDGKTVSKIQVQPQIAGGRGEMDRRDGKDGGPSKDKGKADAKPGDKKRGSR